MTRDNFADFMQAVLQDHGVSGSQWENGTLTRFFDALAAVAWSRRGDSPDTDQDIASWELFAEMIVAATGYE